MLVVRNPPHVAVAPARLGDVVALGEGVAVAAAADVLHRRARDDLLAVPFAAAAQHLAEARQVAQAGVQAAAGELGAHAFVFVFGFAGHIHIAPACAVRAWERGTLYGLTVYPRRGVSYRDIDPALCRELFIR